MRIFLLFYAAVVNVIQFLSVLLFLVLKVSAVSPYLNVRRHILPAQLVSHTACFYSSLIMICTSPPVCPLHELYRTHGTHTYTIQFELDYHDLKGVIHSLFPSKHPSLIPQYYLHQFILRYILISLSKFVQRVELKKILFFFSRIFCFLHNLIKK